MNKLSKWGSVLGAVMALALVGCGGSKSSRVPSTPESPHQADASSPAAPDVGPGGYEGESTEEKAYDDLSGAPKGTTSAPAPRAAESTATGGAEIAKPRRYEPAPPPERPGLGTAWGETRHSPTTTAPFVRDSASPFAVATLWYNDRTGANAMSRWADYRSHASGAVPVLGGALTVSLLDAGGRQLGGFFAGGKDYVIGEAGMRYIIVVRNNTGYRYECVASVDGLDVIDGRTAAYTKRGYVIQPHGMLQIEGFRRSADQVAAFRFSSVRGSYASRSGQGDRNVGVIGIAFFNEEGTQPTWTPDEIRRRHGADPFPGRYAEPPRY